ncbi:MAG: helix-turn-helix domain-containing protein [Patescibacteria group bacterium]|nr:hypothetical protein [Patescibacteria group bacterium]
MLKRALEEIGFTDKEVAVYTSLLELGPQPASVVARKAKLNRSTTYVVLNGLLGRGVIGRFNRSDIQHFAATNPDTLLEYIDRTKKDLERHHKTIKGLIPHMRFLGNPYTSKPKVSYFDGIEGVKRVMEDTLSAKDALLCYSAVDRWLSGPLKDYIEDYGKRRVNSKKIPLRGLVHDTKVAREYLGSDYPAKLTKTRWIPKDLAIFGNEINIYNDKVSIVSLDPDEMFGVIIENPSIADTQKQIFELAWRGAAED